MSDLAPNGDEWTGHEEVEFLRKLLEVQQGESDRLVEVAHLVGDAVNLLGTISTNLATFLQEWQQANTEPKPQAVTGHIGVVKNSKESTVGLQVTDTGDGLTYQFDDEFGNVAAPPNGDGSGLALAFNDTAEFDESGASVPVGTLVSVGTSVQGTDANGNAIWTAPLTFVGPDGSFSTDVVVSNVSGAPLVDNDGVTDFVQAASETVTVAAGQATTGTEGTS